MVKVHRVNETVFNEIGSIQDPEMPTVTIGELGILREVSLCDDGRVKVVFTPTHSECPAMNYIESMIIDTLLNMGIEKFILERRLHPAWSSDWINDEGKSKLRGMGVVSPSRKYNQLMHNDYIECPKCGSRNVEMKSPFGSALCKSFFVCRDCKEPFDYIKPF